MSADLIQFPQQKAWQDAQELAAEQKEREQEERQHVEFNVECLYHGGWSASYARLLSDPPAVFRVRRFRPGWGSIGHFIANRERMPISPSSIRNPHFNGGLIIEPECGTGSGQ